MKHYIFRWKEDGVCVIPSRSGKPAKCWEFALKWLLASSLTPKKGRELVRKLGEVVEEED